VLLRKEVAALARALVVAHMNRGTERYLGLKIDRHLVEAHHLSEPLLYKSLASKVGLLSADLVIAITEFHQNCQEAKSWLPLLVEDEERNYGYVSSAVLAPARAAVRNVAPALRKIESMASIPRPAEDPDLGMTEDVIELEEKLFNTRATPKRSLAGSQ
jgi:hypothetical protein